MKWMLLLLLAGSYAQAGFDATVKMVRGKVTVLKPKMHEVEIVKKGDVLPQNSSVLTGDKSIVKLKFKDMSVVSLGPKSKITIDKSKQKEKNVISLLKGVIRAEVKKSKNKQKNKMLIKTRTAVMGIRGTKLKTSYNPKNTNTSLVTIEGDVAMAKVEKDPIIEAFNEKKESKDIENIIEKNLEEKLESESVSVKIGRFSGVIKDKPEPTKPVKIAPKQLVALVKKDELADEKVNISDEEILEEAAQIDTEEEKKKVESKQSKDIVNARAGGMIDFDTAIYVEPTEEAVFDNKNHVYVDDSKLIGDIDENSGDYIPPKGIELDATKGFVIKDSKEVQVASNDLSVVRDTLSKLNKKVEKQVKEKSYAKIDFSQFKKYLPKNHYMTVKLSKSVADYTIEVPDGKNLKIDQENIENLDITFNQEWSSKDRTYLHFGLTKIDLEDASSSNLDFFESDYLNHMKRFRIGYQRQLTSRLELELFMGDEDRVFFEHDSFAIPNPILRGESRSLDSYGVGLNYFAFEKNKISAYAKLYYTRLESLGEEGPSSISSGEPDKGSVMLMGADIHYAYTENTKLLVGLNYNYFQLRGTEGFHVNRKAISLGTGFIWDY